MDYPVNAHPVTYVVAIDPRLNGDIDNLFHLPPTFMTSRGDTAIVHRNPSCATKGGIVVANFDVLITMERHTFEKEAWEYVPYSSRVLRLNRYQKPVQHLLMNNYAHRENLKGFVNIPTYMNVSNDTTLGYQRGYGMGSYDNQSVDYVIIRPANGARGLHHFVVEAKYGNIHAFFKAFEMAKIEVTKPKAPGSVSDSSASTIDEFIQLIRDNYSGKFDYFHGQKGNTEGLSHLLDDPLFVQKMVTDVDKEFRILTGAKGEPAVAVQRVRNEHIGQDFKYHQATGAGMADNVWSLEHIPIAKEYWEEFCTMCRELIGPLNSVDLFITESGKWGIFEYCNQFGTTGVPNQLAELVHIGVVESLIYEE